jgi:hypothetical protein
MSTYDPVALETIQAYSPYELANIAGSHADNDVAKEFFVHVRDAVLDRTDEISADNWGPLMVEDYDGSAHEIADRAPSIYTYRLWQQFVGVRGWEENLDEYGVDLLNDMGKAAAVSLYIIAGRLVSVLAAAIGETIDEETQP